VLRLNRAVHSCPFSCPFGFPLGVLSVLSARNMVVTSSSFWSCPFTKESSSRRVKQDQDKMGGDLRETEGGI